MKYARIMGAYCACETTATSKYCKYHEAPVFAPVSVPRAPASAAQRAAQARHPAFTQNQPRGSRQHARPPTDIPTCPPRPLRRLRSPTRPTSCGRACRPARPSALAARPLAARCARSLVASRRR